MKIAFLPFLIFCSVVFAQDQKSLAFRPIDAKWSAPLQRIITISTNPNQLQILNPQTNTFASVALSKAPNSFSLSPNGLYAAVGHENLISYVNLSNATLEKTFVTAVNVQGHALGSQSIFVPALGSILIATGAITGPAITASPLILDPTEQYLYNPDTNFRWVLASGSPANSAFLSRSALVGCGPYWFLSNNRAVDACSVVGSMSADADMDLRYATTLEGIYPTGAPPALAQSVAESATRVAAIVQLINFNGPSPAAYSQIFLFEPATLHPAGQYLVPDFVVAGTPYAALGKWIFFDSTGGSLYVISQAHSNAGLANDFGLYTLPLASPPPCTLSLATTSATVSASGAVLKIPITAAQNCLHQASNSNAWIKLGSGAAGSGNRTLTVAVRPNSGGARSGNISIGPATFTVNQTAAGTISGMIPLPVKVADAAFSRQSQLVRMVAADPPDVATLNPLNGAMDFLDLPKTPLSVSTAPGANTWVVGFDGWLYYFNGSAASLIKIPGQAMRVVLAANGFAYAFTRRGVLLSVKLSDGSVSEVSQFGGFFGPYLPALHPSGLSIYYFGARYDITDGPAEIRPLGTDPFCGHFWITQDGSRLVDSCSNVFRLSDNPTLDMQPNGVLSQASSGTTAVAHSSIRKTMVIGTPASPFNNLPVYGSELQAYGDNAQTFAGGLSLPEFTVGGQQFRVGVRYLFWADGLGPDPDPNAALVVVAQADPAANLVSDYGYTLYRPGAATNCVQLPVTSAVASTGGSSGSIAVNTTAIPCMWDARTTAPWLNVTNGGLRIGSGNVSYTAAANTTGSARSATIAIGGIAFTINQPAGSGTLQLNPSSTTINAFGASYTINVIASQPGLQWTAQSNSPWITISSGASGTGSGSVTIQVLPNNGAMRTGTVTIAGMIFNVTQSGFTGYQFVPVTPCRVVDTRNAPGPFGQPSLVSQVERSFAVSQSACGIPANAAAFSLNVTVIPKTTLGYLTIWPSGQNRPLVSTLNSLDGRIKANAAIVPAGVAGGVSVFATDASDVVLDINGYFVPPQAGSLAFYPLTPCRIVDTRQSATLEEQSTRTFQTFNTCSIPPTARALSLNTTIIPRGPFGYLSIWPTGTAQPVVSTLNALTGTITANAAIVPVGTGGSISTYVTSASDLLLDVNGYFAEPGAPNALQFYALNPCRLVDNRNPAGPFGGPANQSLSTRDYAIPNADCHVPGTAQAYALNTTVLPSEPFGYLTLWPAASTRPVVSTLNAIDGALTSNAAIVQAGLNGAISTFVTNAGALLIDISGYFAR
jgi:hypothetical protein